MPRPPAPPRPTNTTYSDGRSALWPEFLINCPSKEDILSRIRDGIIAAAGPACLTNKNSPSSLTFEMDLPLYSQIPASRSIPAGLDWPPGVSRVQSVKVLCKCASSDRRTEALLGRCRLRSVWTMLTTPVAPPTSHCTNNKGSVQAVQMKFLLEQQTMLNTAVRSDPSQQSGNCTVQQTGITRSKVSKNH